MAEIVQNSLSTAQSLTGRLAEYQELIDVGSQRPGLTVVSADPLSGTSALLQAAVEPLSPMILVDARRATDSLDLAMAIADSTVLALAPRAYSWWTHGVASTSAEGLRLHRSVASHGVDLDDLRLGSGSPTLLIRDAMALVTSVGEGHPILAIDHLGRLLDALGRDQARKLLGEVRAARQAHEELDLLLVEQTDGPISRSLGDSDHPLFQAGQLLRFRRPEPERFINDLVITRGLTDVSTDVLSAAAELANGVPALTWRIVELAPDENFGGGETRALAGWRELRRLTEPSYARAWDVLRHVHRLAHAVIAAISVEIGPYEIHAPDKTIRDCLTRLRRTGVVWQPRKRQWAVSDPLLSAWAKDYAPSWTLHRLAQARL